MPTIEFMPSGATLEVASGTNLLEAARAAGLEIELPCGGEGTCGRCLVRVTEGEVVCENAGRLPDSAVAAGYVLACEAHLVGDRITIEVPERLSLHDMQSTDVEARRLVDEALLPRHEDIDPKVCRWDLQVDPPRLADGLSDLDRLTRVIGVRAPEQEVTYSLPVMRAVAEALREEHGTVTVSLIRDSSGIRVIGIEAGMNTGRHFGIAVDLGTTTVAAQLVDLNTGRILATVGDYNDQITCGADVISRINYAARSGGLEELRARALETINRLLCEAAAACSVNPAEILEAVVSGNTLMTHLILGLEPEYIRLEPYTPTVLESPVLSASELGVGIAPDAPVQLSPCVGSYVGGDITAGLLCTDLAIGTNEIVMFIDVGTNGEIVIGNSDFLMACACSAGPAFEGGGMACGMRAAKGAINRVSVDRRTARPIWSTIADASPLGICGSGMIDVLANLLLTGWIDRKGRLDRSRLSPHIRTEGKRAHYVVVPAGESATGRAISISELEIESIIRAKAAVYSAAALMLDRLELGFDDLGAIYIAGSFGRHLDIVQAIMVGMLPDVPHDTFRYVDNASLMGSYMALVSPTHRRRQHELARRLTYVELSTEPAYMEQYTAALFLPHTDLGLFPSVTARSPAAE
jgi:uncharacterized 2Fe-2S/4Fe-4S cluster protein (DUF4445 family)